jgi:hypothetical protein
MRQGYNGEIWRDDLGQIIALNLGSDFCAEHEWGIAGIKNTFAIDPTIPGIEGRTIKNKSVTLNTFGVRLDIFGRRSTKKIEKLTLYGLVPSPKWKYSSETNSDYSWVTKGSMWDPEKDQIKGYWSESRFLFLLEKKSEVDEFVEAFSRADISIWLGSAGPFKGGGLCIAITSRLPKEFTDSMMESDLDHIKLKKFFDKTGIEKILSSAGKKYYALSPRWKNDEKTEIQVWLNPSDQDIHNYGWYTIDELKQWANNKGPIIKKADK